MAVRDIMRICQLSVVFFQAAGWICPFPTHKNVSGLIADHRYLCHVFSAKLADILLCDNFHKNCAEQ